MQETQILFNRIFILVIFLSCSVPTHAQEQSFNFEITPFGAYRYGGEFEETDRNFSIELDDKESYGLILNVRHSPVTQWEILYSRQETSADTIGLGLSDPQLDISVEYLQAGGTYLWDGDHARPFLAATLGVTQIDISNPGYDSDSFFSFSLGLGLQIRPTSRLGIRLEARGYGTLLDSNSDLFCAFGPSNNVCAIRIDGTIMWQVEALAGIVFRF
jgi:opacity protein-like surface antigen